MPFILDAFLFKSLALYTLYEPISWLYLFRGYLSDILQCIPFLILYNITDRKYGNLIVFILFSLLISANTEHILVNKGNITYESIHYIQDKQFLSGSALSFRAIILFLLSFIALILLHSLSPYVNSALIKLPHHLKVRKPVLFLTAVTLTTITPISVFNSSWQQQSFLEQNLSSYSHTLLNRKNGQYISSAAYTEISDIKKKNGQYQLLNPYEVNDGKPVLNALNPEKNILLILVEGLSQHQMMDNTLRNLKWTPKTGQ